MDASWQPDPTGRHQYRWWDGFGWGDAVADHGVQSRDPMGEPAPTAAADDGAARAAVGVAETATTPGTGRVTVSTTPEVEPAAPRVTVSTTPSGGQPRPTAPLPAYSGEPVRMPSGISKLIAAAVVVLALIGGVLYLFLFRDTSRPEVAATGTTTGHLDGPGSVVFRDLKLKRGQAVRFRVEGDPRRDLVTYFLAPKTLANLYATEYVSDIGKNIGITDPAEVIGTYSDARELFTDPRVQDSVRGYVTVKNVDRCCKGVPDAASFIASAAGTYRIVVVEAEGKASDVKIIVEGFDRQLTAYTDIRGTLDSNGFFTDTGFYTDTENYEPDSGG